MLYHILHQSLVDYSYRSKHITNCFQYYKSQILKDGAFSLQEVSVAMKKLTGKCLDAHTSWFVTWKQSIRSIQTFLLSWHERTTAVRGERKREVERKREAWTDREKVEVRERDRRLTGAETVWSASELKQRQTSESTLTFQQLHRPRVIIVLTAQIWYITSPFYLEGIH